MSHVLNNMNISWICTTCGATNYGMGGVCQECSSEYGARPTPVDSGVNQALLNQGVIFNNAVFNPPKQEKEPSLGDMCRSVETLYRLNEPDTGAEKKPQKESFGMRVFTWTCTIATWFALLIAGSVFAFFVFVFIKAFSNM